MEYRYLTAFLLTARHKSFSRAAEELHIAQSAVSRQIKLLEESMGEQLFFRSPQNVILTDRGRQLYEEASRWEDWSASFMGKQDPVIRIGALQGVLDNWLVQRVSEIFRERPCRLVLEGNTTAGILDLMHQGRLDFGLINEEIETELITSRKVFFEELVVISSKPVQTHRLHQYRWIFTGSGAHLRRLSGKPSVSSIQVSSMSALVGLVREGMGIAVVPSHVVEGCDDLVTQGLPRLPSEAIWLAAMNYERWPPHLRGFWDQLGKKLPPRSSSRQ